MICDNNSTSCNNLFVREDILKELIKCVSDIREGYRHNIAIIGRGLIGKSSLLLHFVDTIQGYDRLLPLYIDVRDTSFFNFVESFINILLSNALKKIDGPQREKIISSRRSKLARSHFPRSCNLAKRIREAMTDKNFDEVYSSLWDLCVVLNSESGLFPVLILDEFDRLSSFPIKKPFSILGEKIMVQHKTIFVLSSSSTITARKVISEKLSLLFGNFQIIEIAPLLPEQARLFIEKELIAIDVPPNLKEFLVSFTGCHPFYLASIIKNLGFIIQKKPCCPLSAHLSQAIAETLFCRDGAINQFFLSLLEKLKYKIAEHEIFNVLKTLLVPIRHPDISKLSGVSLTQLNLILGNLVEAGVVSKNGSLYAITDAVFRMWVEVRTKPKNLYFDFMDNEELTLCVREVERRLSYFESEKRKTLDEKIIELVDSFKNDRFFIDERMRLLPHLSFVYKQDVDRDHTFLVVQASRRWLFVICKQDITEDEMYNIIQKVKGFEYHPAKVILISTGAIDNAAKLLAKQKRILIWSRDDLNRIFQFYKGHSTIVA